MPHALLLSPDDQAVSAISGVLEEMSVTCERPLDGVSAAQKLNSQSFDLVLVDCENLPAAKLIFDVCRRGKGGNNAVPIAIVDGRAGLPTAFRLGAELILTKPVAKDQARTTIRTAVGRVRKDTPINEASALSATAASPEDRAQTISYEDANPSFARGSVPPSYLTAALTASGLTTRTADEVHQTGEREQASEPSVSASYKSSASDFSAMSDFSASESSSEPEQTSSSSYVNAKLARLRNPADDLVLAEIDRSANDGLDAAQLTLEGTDSGKTALKEANKSNERTSFPHHEGRRGMRAPLVATAMLAVAAGGFFAAWNYQPGFREIAKPQIEHLLDLAGKGLPPAASQNQAKPSPQLADAKPAAPAPSSPSVTSTNPTAANPTPSSVASSSTPSAAASAVSTPASQPAGIAPSAIVVAKAAPAPGAPATSQAEANKTATPKPSDSKTENQVEAKKEVASLPLNADLPGEDNAIILSSKGAEKRLAHSVSPKLPADASAQGKVVLKTVVNETGQVQAARLVEGNASLAPAAIQAVKQWRYRPYVRDGKALPFQTVVFIDFQKR